MAQDYFTILTTIGKAKAADAIANGTDIGLSEIAVGDGDYTPSESQTSLVSEKYRAAANQVIQDPENENRIIAELVIPSATGGWNVREVGVFDSLGDLFAVGRFPATYKPTFEEGSGKELVIRIVLEIGNQANVTLTVDPTVVIATLEAVNEAVATHEAKAGAHAAADLDYDNAVSGLTADDVQAAIDEVVSESGSALAAHLAADPAHPAEKISFDNTASGLTAENVQAAVDELAGRLGNLFFAGGLFYKSGAQALTVKPLVCASDDGTDQIVFSAETVNDPTTNGAGGLDTGSLAAGSQYFLWGIKNPTTGVSDTLSSLSGTSPTLPTGFTKKRLVGAWRTDAAGNVVDSSICPAGADGLFIGGWFLARNIQADGTGGGSNTAATWSVYPFNTAVYNMPGASLPSAGTIELPPGLWRMEASLNLRDLDTAEIDLYNLTDTAQVTKLRSVHVPSGGYHQEAAHPVHHPGVFHASAKQYQLRVYGQSNGGSAAFGYPTGMSNGDEYYGWVKFTKIGA